MKLLTVEDPKASLKFTIVDVFWVEKKQDKCMSPEDTNN